MSNQTGFLMDTNFSRDPYILFSRSRTPPGVTPTGATFWGGAFNDPGAVRHLVQWSMATTAIQM